MRIWYLVVAAASVAGFGCHRVRPTAGPEFITERDPICGWPGTRSGGRGDRLDENDQRIGMTGTATIVGRIVSADGRPLIQALAGVPELRLGASTDSTGKFVLRLPSPGLVEVKFLRIGYLRQQQQFWAIAGRVDTVCVRLRAVPVPVGPMGFEK